MDLGVADEAWGDAMTGHHLLEVLEIQMDPHEATVETGEAIDRHDHLEALVEAMVLLMTVHGDLTMRSFTSSRSSMINRWYLHLHLRCLTTGSIP